MNVPVISGMLRKRRDGARAGAAARWRRDLAAIRQYREFAYDGGPFPMPVIELMGSLYGRLRNAKEDGDPRLDEMVREYTESTGYGVRKERL